ncbi:MAG TPA: chorismate mutase [Longimicrobiales bacterium]|nr:chorismate mutase [Longimicrobiales bacterium]
MSRPPGATDNGEEDWPPELEELRAAIEAVDDRIIDLLAERVRLARRVGAAKLTAGLPTLDPRREAAVVRRAGERARAAGMEDEDVRYIFWHVIGLSRRAQLEEM